MQIKHDITRGGERQILITELDPLTADLTRIIQSKIHSISMKHKTTLADLYRLTSLDDETFELMAYLQKEREDESNTRNSSTPTAST